MRFLATRVPRYGDAHRRWTHAPHCRVPAAKLTRVLSTAAPLPGVHTHCADCFSPRQSAHLCRFEWVTAESSKSTAAVSNHARVRPMASKPREQRCSVRAACRAMGSLLDGSSAVLLSMASEGSSFARGSWSQEMILGVISTLSPSSTRASADLKPLELVLSDANGARVGLLGRTDVCVGQPCTMRERVI